MIREFALQLKLGSVRPSYFQDKYGVDVRSRFQEPLVTLREDGYLTAANGDDDRLRLTRDGLLRVDSLLPRFFLEKHTNIRYT